MITTQGVFERAGNQHETSQHTVKCIALVKVD